MTQDKRIAVVTQGVKLADEVRGYTRFRKVAEVLVEAGYEVDLITSSFHHWDKAQRDTARRAYRELPYNVVFVSEPGYARNLDPRRIYSHRVLARNLQARFDALPHAYDLIYSEIPPNDMALVCARTAKDWGVPYVADINDLWPEAMRMAVDIPVLSDIAFRPFSRQARKTYNLLNAAVGTSDEYAMRPAQDREEPYPHVTVYVGNDLQVFDDGVRDYGAEIEKPEGAFWVTYAGTLGASYDIATLIASAEALKDFHPLLRVKVLGDGPDRESLQQLADSLNAPVDFLGYVDYAHMAAWLANSDVMVNSLVKQAPQSVVTKIGDYLASGHPVINTGSSSEMRALVQREGFGVNVEAEDVSQLAEAIHAMMTDSQACQEMGAKARIVAERDFDQRNSYQKIVDLVRGLLA